MTATSDRAGAQAVDGAGQRRRIAAVLLAVLLVGGAMAAVVVVGGVAPPEAPPLAEAPLPGAEGTVAFLTWWPDPCLSVADVATGRVRQLRCERNLGSPRWSPDGEVVVDRYGGSGFEELVLSPADGHVLGRTVDPDPPAVEEPVRRPDGARLVTGGRDRTSWVEVVDAAGAATRLLEVRGPRGYELVEASWAPDGEHVLLRDTESRLLVLSPAGALRLLATDVAEATWGG
jgi:dipeptidyl aminopeptidase/acylaminoacyl peptidase